MSNPHFYWESKFVYNGELYIGVGPNTTSARAKARTIYLNREGGPPPPDNELEWTDTEMYGAARTDTP